MKGGELMAYKALYRKYRPTLFNDVVGQDVIVKTLLNAIKENKISHAYLFNGPEELEKLALQNFSKNYQLFKSSRWTAM